MLASVFPFSGFALNVFPFSVFPFKLPSYGTEGTCVSGEVGTLWYPGYVVGSLGSCNKCECTRNETRGMEKNGHRTSSMPQVSRARTTSRRLTAAAVTAVAGVPGSWATSSAGPSGLRTPQTAPVGAAYSSGGSRTRWRQ